MATLDTRAFAKAADSDSRRALWLAAGWVGVCFGLIYLPDCGLGFIKDDYSWISSSRLDGWDAVIRLFRTAPMQFYRPMVSLSFGLDRALFGLNARPYGLTNFGLTLAAAGSIGWLVRRLGFPAAIALFAAAVWVFNFHGIGFAVLWTSGRTSLLGTLFAVGAAVAFASARPIACGFFTLLALLSKEEPLLLPVVFLLWAMIDRREAAADARKIHSCVAAAVATAIYLGLRWQSGAMTPGSAPDFYRYQLAAIPTNALQYVDRSLTLTLGLLVLGALFVHRKRWTLTPLERSTIAKGLVWLVFGFALTIMIPVRSSLYVCFPSVGSSLILAAVASAEWRAIDRRRLVLVALLLLPLGFLPVYWARNRELGNEQRLAANALRTLSAGLAGRQADQLIVYDDPRQRPSVSDAFGNALPVALRLVMPANAPAVITVTAEKPATPTKPGTVEFVLDGLTLVERSRE